MTKARNILMYLCTAKMHDSRVESMFLQYPGTLLQWYIQEICTKGIAIED